MKKLNADAIIGLITALFGFSVALYTHLEPKMTFIPQTSDGVPGGGFFPMIFGLLLGFLGVALFLAGLKKGGSGDSRKKDDDEVRLNSRQLCLTVGSIVLFFVLWQITNVFTPWAAALVFGLNFIFERKLKFNIIYTVVFIAFIYLAFRVGFKINFNL